MSHAATAADALLRAAVAQEKAVHSGDATRIETALADREACFDVLRPHLTPELDEETRAILARVREVDARILDTSQSQRIQLRDELGTVRDARRSVSSSARREPPRFLSKRT